MSSRFCIHYVSKSGRPSSGYRTGKSQSSSLITHASKDILKILHARCQRYGNQELPDVQAGFKKGRGTRDQTASICCIIEKAREFQKKTSLSFINYAEAFDCVDHDKLWKALREMGTPDHLTCLLRNLYLGQEATVRILYRTTHWFTTEKGVRQTTRLAQTHVHRAGDAIQPTCPLWPASSPALNYSQHQSLFQSISTLHQVVRVLKLQLQHQSFKRIFRVNSF